MLLYMKKVNRVNLFLLLTIIYASMQCNKTPDDPQLPPETTTGAMTFGCKVGGKVFIPKDSRG